MAMMVAAFLIGAALLGWAVFGALLLRGDVVIEQKENVESMAKLMLYLAGPLGAILIVTGVALATMRRS